MKKAASGTHPKQPLRPDAAAKRMATLAAELKLERSARAVAETALQAREEWMGRLGHELRNPLNAISSAVEVLGRGAGSASLAPRALEIIARQCRRLSEMLDGLASGSDMPRAPPPAEAGSGKALKIVLLEDNEDVQQALQSMLEMDGHQVLVESDGVAGLELLLREAPDAAIVDVGLPGLDGIEIALRARGAGYGGHMVALSGYRHAAQQGLDAGFDVYLVKPVETGQLRASLARTRKANQNSTLADAPSSQVRPGADSK